MPKGNKKKIEEKAFAQAYLEHGMNATQAAMAIKPHITHKSAGVEGSRLLERVSKTGAIDSVLGDVKNHWQDATRKAIALAHNWLDGNDKQLQLHAMKFLQELGKVVAGASAQPRSATQINNYKLPKA